MWNVADTIRRIHGPACIRKMIYALWINIDAFYLFWRMDTRRMVARRQLVLSLEARVFVCALRPIAGVHHTVALVRRLFFNFPFPLSLPASLSPSHMVWREFEHCIGCHHWIHCAELSTYSIFSIMWLFQYALPRTGSKSCAQ